MRNRMPNDCLIHKLSVLQKDMKGTITNDEKVVTGLDKHSMI